MSRSKSCVWGGAALGFVCGFNLFAALREIKTAQAISFAVAVMAFCFLLGLLSSAICSAIEAQDR